jgi:hypothetical protein
MFYQCITISSGILYFLGHKLVSWAWPPPDSRACYFCSASSTSNAQSPDFSFGIGNIHLNVDFYGYAIVPGGLGGDMLSSTVLMALDFLTFVKGFCNLYIKG